MPLVLDDLIAATTAVSTVLNESMKLVGAIRGRFSNNEAAKEALRKELTELQANLQAVGKLARAAETYTETRESIAELLWHCRRAERFTRDFLTSPAADEASRALSWKVLEEIFEAIRSNSETPRSVVLGSAEWYDREDYIGFTRLLNQFTQAYNKADVAVRNHFERELPHELRTMTDRLQEVDTALGNTLHGKIFANLGKIG